MAEETAHLKERGPNPHGLCCQTAPGGCRSSVDPCWGLSPLPAAKCPPPRPDTQRPPSRSLSAAAAGHMCWPECRDPPSGPRKAGLWGKTSRGRPQLARGAEPQRGRGKQHLSLAWPLSWPARWGKRGSAGPPRPFPDSPPNKYKPPHRRIPPSPLPKPAAPAVPPPSSHLPGGSTENRTQERRGPAGATSATPGGRRSGRPAGSGPALGPTGPGDPRAAA